MSSVTLEDAAALEQSPSPSGLKASTVTLSTAGVRAIVYQLQSIMLRTPAKLFRPSRFDYFAVIRARAEQYDNLKDKPYKLRTHSTLAMLVKVIRKEGWKLIPDQILPPFIANSVSGMVLYSTYLGITGSESPSYWDSWKGGFVAGAVQSFVAAPVDAIFTRSSVSEVINGLHQNLWVYGVNKLKEIGLSGVFAGYAFSFVKESLGFAFYFSTFETIKTKFYNMTYGILVSMRRFKRRWMGWFLNPTVYSPDEERKIILEQKRLTKILKSAFVLFAGASAAFSLLAIQYPISKVQNIHLARLETLDIYNASRNYQRRKPFIKVYYNSYKETYQQIVKMKRKSRQTWGQFAYKGFLRNTITTIPAISVGLLVFEMLRARIVDEDELLQS